MSLISPSSSPADQMVYLSRAPCVSLRQSFLHHEKIHRDLMTDFTSKKGRFRIRHDCSVLYSSMTALHAHTFHLVSSLHAWAHWGTYRSHTIAGGKGWSRYAILSGKRRKHKKPLLPSLDVVPSTVNLHIIESTANGNMSILKKLPNMSERFLPQHDVVSRQRQISQHYRGNRGRTLRHMTRCGAVCVDRRGDSDMFRYNLRLFKEKKNHCDIRFATVEKCRFIKTSKQGRGKGASGCWDKYYTWKISENSHKKGTLKRKESFAKVAAVRQPWVRLFSCCSGNKPAEIENIHSRASLHSTTTTPLCCHRWSLLNGNTSI